MLKVEIESKFKIMEKVGLKEIKTPDFPDCFYIIACSENGTEPEIKISHSSH
jgi:hypothetical protein